LLNFVCTFGLTQFVHFPTRGENVLDIIMSNDDQIINSIYSAPPIGHSDHAIVNFTLYFKIVIPVLS